MVLAICLGVRLAAWLIAPVLPLLGGITVVVAIAVWLMSGHRSGHWRQFR